jgi:hypothetical protein
MDAFIAAVVAGVIVALVSAIAAFYFGGVREEKRRQVETLRRLNERRAEAADGLRGQAYSAAEALKAWAREISDTLSVLALQDEEVEVVPTGWREQTELFLKAFATFEETGAEVEKRMASLRGYYQARSADLGAEASKVFNTFEGEFEERYQQISDPVKRSRKLLDEAYDLVGTRGVFKQAVRLPRLLGFKRGKMREAMQKNFSELGGGVELALSWNYKTHIEALEAEIKRATGMNLNE